MFDEEGHIGDLGQLKAVFFAMASYEIGEVDGKQFKVPERDWVAGLELVETGLKTAGTESTDVAVHVPETGMLAPKISASVGAYEQGAVNKTADVETVQALLREAAMILGNSALDPGGIDGAIAEKAKDSDTVAAIVAFQRRYFNKPDGLIEKGGRTWRELLAVVNGGAQTMEETLSTAGVEYFPFMDLPSVNWTDSPRKFAAARKNGRAHAGCDLYFPEGTVIHAIADGTVMRGPYPFYAETYALEVNHGTFTARYGKIQAEAMVRVGERVRAGQPIARVGHLVGISVPSDMLHLELYGNTEHGPLSVSASLGAVSSDGRPFMRRKDLMDPTPKLNVWKNNRPTQAPAAPVTVAPMVKTGIATTGFCIHLKRLREETRSGMGFARTVGEYQCYWNGAKIAGMSGQMVERGGPGDNTDEVGDKFDRCIEAGTYRLAIQDGSLYKTYNYTTGAKRRSHPMPGILLLDTGEREAILIHRGEDYVKSVGCLNPVSGLTNAKSAIDFDDSRERVIGFIDAMKTKIGMAFPKSGAIPGAVIIIEEDL